MRAQDWSVGVSSGAFLFGDFVERRFPAPGGTGGAQTVTLSADTRPGLSVDIQRQFSERWSLGVEGTFVRSPLRVGRGVELESGELDVMTIAVPIIFHINRGGALRFHLFAGPAYAGYRIEQRTNAPRAIPLFRGTRAEWGGQAGGGIRWMWSERFAVEAEISDIVTHSPFRQEEIAAPRTTIKRPHNAHTTVGVRYRF